MSNKRQFQFQMKFMQIKATIILLLIAISKSQINRGNVVPYYYQPPTATSDAENNANREGVPGNNDHQVVVPRYYGRWNYQMWDSHYSGNFYTASGADDLTWGREHHQERNFSARAIKRSWIEAIQDHECFVEEPFDSNFNGLAGTDADRNTRWNRPRDTCVICGIGGCERIDLYNNANNGAFNGHNHGQARNGTTTAGIFRHSDYNDWLGVFDGSPGANVGANGANTYRSEAVSTVAVIQRTSYFLSGGSGLRGVTRFNIESNSTYVPWGNMVAATGGAITNNATEVVDIFIVRPSTWAVVTLRNSNYRILDYTNMNVAGNFPVALATGTSPQGGFGDYIDWQSRNMNVCISQDYSTKIYCYQLTNGGGGATATIGFELAHLNAITPITPDPQPTIAPANPVLTSAQIATAHFRVRSLQGIYESPHFGVCFYDRIRVYSIWNHATHNAFTPLAGLPGGLQTNWEAEYVETLGGRDTNNINFNQIWDITYINTHWYRAANNAPGWEHSNWAWADLTGSPPRTDYVGPRPFEGWETYHRKWNVRAGPNRRDDVLGGRRIAAWQAWPGSAAVVGPPAVAATPWLWGQGLTQFDGADPRERFFFVTHDKGKTVWWKANYPNAAARDAFATAGGSLTSCHPFCHANCHFPFSKRWCRGDRCAQRGTDPQNNDNNVAVNEFWIRNPGYFEGQPTWNTNYRTDLPLECNTQEYMRYPQTNDMQVNAPADYNPIWGIDSRDNPDTHWPINFDNSRSVTVKPPRTAVPYRNTPPTVEPVITTTTAGVVPPPFIPVPHNSTAVNATPIANPVRPEASEWWKWTLLGLIGVLLLGLLIGALCLIPKNPVRRPIVREVQEVQQKFIPPPKQEVIYKATPRKTIVEKQIIEKKTPVVSTKKEIVTEKLITERGGFNPYKQKKVGFRL